VRIVLWSWFKWGFSHQRKSSTRFWFSWARNCSTRKTYKAAVQGGPDCHGSGQIWIGQKKKERHFLGLRERPDRTGVLVGWALAWRSTIWLSAPKLDYANADQIHEIFEIIWEHSFTGIPHPQLSGK
jgi:hypothetical protein